MENKKNELMPVYLKAGGGCFLGNIVKIKSSLLGKQTKEAGIQCQYWKL